MTSEGRPPDPTAGILNEERFAEYDLRALLAVLRSATRIEVEGDEVLRRAGAGLRLNEFDVLAFIYASGSIRPAELGNLVAMSGSAPTIHNIVTRLAKRGYVTREPHPEDSRGVLLSITDAGRAAIHETYPIIERKVINRFAGHFRADELRALAELLERT